MAEIYLLAFRYQLSFGKIVYITPNSEFLSRLCVAYVRAMSVITFYTFFLLSACFLSVAPLLLLTTSIREADICPPVECRYFYERLDWSSLRFNSWAGSIPRLARPMIDVIRDCERIFLDFSGMIINHGKQRCSPESTRLGVFYKAKDCW